MTRASWVSLWGRDLQLHAGAWTKRLQDRSAGHGRLASRVVEARFAERDADLLQARRFARLYRVLQAAARTRGHAHAAGVLADRAVAGSESLDVPLSGLPLMTKQWVRHGIKDLLVPDPGPVDVRITSGTSGEVVQIARPRAATIERAAVDRRLFDALGLPSFFTLALVVPWRQEVIDSWGFNDWKLRLRQIGLAELMAELSRGRVPAELLVSSPAACQRIAGSGLTGARLTSAWELSRSTRALLGLVPEGQPETASELYVAAEMSAPIAVRYPNCPHLHVNADAVHVEVVHPATGESLSPRSAGALVLTDLLNTSMPFVRYLIGDAGALLDSGECRRCGRVTPTLLLLGRVGARMEETKRLAASLRQKAPWVLVEHDSGAPVLLTDHPVDPVLTAKLGAVAPLPNPLRSMPHGGLFLSVAERYPVEVWENRTIADLGVGARNPHAALRARRHGPVSRDRQRRVG